LDGARRGVWRQCAGVVCWLGHDGAIVEHDPDWHRERRQTRQPQDKYLRDGLCPPCLTDERVPDIRGLLYRAMAVLDVAAVPEEDFPQGLRGLGALSPQTTTSGFSFTSKGRQYGRDYPVGIQARHSVLKLWLVVLLEDIGQGQRAHFEATI
jgi:hypothetical protein